MERNQSKVAEVITELILAARLRQSRKVIFIIGREPGSFSATGPFCLLSEWPLLWHPLFVHWIPKTEKILKSDQVKSCRQETRNFLSAINYFFVARYIGIAVRCPAIIASVPWLDVP